MTETGENNAVLVDAAPGVLPPRVDEDDPIATIEETIRAMTLTHADEELKVAMSLLERGPAAAARALHLIEGMANIHAQVLVLLGMGAKRTRRRRGAIQMGSPAYYDYVDDLAAEASMGAVDAQIGGETFGNQTIQQLVAMFKSLIQQGGLPGLAAKANQPASGMDIMSLTNALAAAKQGKLGAEVVGALTDKLKEALGGKAPRPTLIGQPIGVEEVVESTEPQEVSA